MWTEWEWGEKQSQGQSWAGQFSSGSRGGVDVLSSDAGGAWGVLEVLFQKGDASWGVHKSLFWDGGDKIWARTGCWDSTGLVARPAWGPAGGDRRVWWGSARVPHGPPWA